MTLKEIKDKKQNDYNELFTACGVFWAFGNEQFKEGLDKLFTNGQMQQGEKITNIGGGGFMPSKNVKALQDGTKAIEATYKAQIAENKQREANILYELINHEAGFTGSIADTLQALGNDYTADEVQAVFNNNKEKIYENI